MFHQEPFFNTHNSRLHVSHILKWAAHAVLIQGYNHRTSHSYPVQRPQKGASLVDHRACVSLDIFNCGSASNRHQEKKSSNSHFSTVVGVLTNDPVALGLDVTVLVSDVAASIVSLRVETCRSRNV